MQEAEPFSAGVAGREASLRLGSDNWGNSRTTFLFFNAG